MLITTLLMTAALTVLQPSGDPGDAQDGVIATAPATAVALDATADPSAPPVQVPGPSTVQELTTDEQIARWLTARTPDPTPFDGAPVWRDDRKVHGEVSVGVGTGGYRDYSVAMSLPIGEGGRLDLSVRQTENDYRYGYPYGYGYGHHGYGFGDRYFDDGGSIFPRYSRGGALEYERRPDAADGSPRRRPVARPLQADQE